MASLITENEKKIIATALDSMHDTFSIEIYVFVEENKAYPVNMNYNPIYNRAKDQAKSQINKILTKYKFQARVSYLPDQSQSLVDLNAQINLVASEGQVRIKVKKDAYEKIKICSRIEIDNILYVLKSDAKIEGPFFSNYYTLYLKREN